MLVTLANVLIRQAEKSDNARQYLDDLITSKATAIIAQNGQIIGVTVNNKTTNFSTPSGASLPQIMAAAELALSYLERGISRVPRSTYSVIR